MKVLGHILSGLGAILIFISFMYDAAPNGTYNIGLLQHQMMLFSVACLMILSGVIFYTVWNVLQRMEQAGLLPPAGVRPIASSTEPDGEA